jgi:hypothetical protein
MDVMWNIGEMIVSNDTPKCSKKTFAPVSLSAPELTHSTILGSLH